MHYPFHAYSNISQNIAPPKNIFRNQPIHKKIHHNLHLQKIFKGLNNQITNQMVKTRNNKNWVTNSK